MAWTNYETLLCMANEFSVTQSFDLVKFIKPGGYRDPAFITGHSEGLMRFSLKFNYLPKTTGGVNGYGVNPGAELGGLQSRADYLWNFFKRHKQQGDKPFILETELPGEAGVQRISVVFADDEMPYELFAVRMFSTGLALEQYREDGDPTGQLFEFQNAAQI